MADDCRIGDWTFDPAAGELRRGGERRRLEDRAARTLELLCRRRGEVVSQGEIATHVWNGRVVSPNSLPVVIADLRRALDDDARARRFIETVAKRGYRLVAPDAGAAPSPAERPRRRVLLLAAALILAALAAAGLWLKLAEQPRAPVVAVAGVVNATGDPAYTPMAVAVSELAAANLARAPVTLVRVPPVRPGEAPVPGRIDLDGKLILWTGEPTVMFTATRDGAVVWSGMAKGPEPAFPASVRAAMAEFAAKVAPDEEA